MQVRATEANYGNTIVHNLSISSQLSLREARVAYLQESCGGTFKIECSRLEAMKIYESIAMLMLDLRRLLIELHICIDLVEIFDTDNQLCFVKFSLFDDRML